MTRKTVNVLVVRSEALIRRHPRLHYTAKRILDRLPVFRERMRRRAIHAAHDLGEEFSVEALSTQGREILSLLLRSHDSSLDR